MNPQCPKEKDSEKRRLSSDSDYGVIVIDPVEEKFHDADRKACSVLGYSRDELLSLTGSATRPFEMSKLITFVRSVAERGFGSTSEFACTSRLGGVFTVEMSASVVSINGSHSIIAVVHKLNEPNGAGDSEREANQLVRALIQASPLAIIANDLDEKVRIWNPAAERIFGWTEQEMLGHPYPLIPEERRDEGREIRERTLRGEVLTSLETRRQKKDGSLVDVAIWTSPLHDAQGNITRVIGVIADLTERTQAEEGILQQVRELAVLEERNRVARELHDTLAQGLTGILLQLEGAEEVLTRRPTAVASYLARAKRLARESLQEARRSVWGLLPQALEFSDLETALEAEVCRFTSAGRVEASFTACGERRDLSARIEANLLRICQEALTNITRHAEATQVAVMLSFCPDTVRMTVQDNGNGFNVGEIKMGGGERGFGLAGIEGRVHSLEGTLTLSSQKAIGTLVDVVLPTPRADT